MPQPQIRPEQLRGSAKPEETRPPERIVEVVREVPVSLSLTASNGINATTRENAAHLELDNTVARLNQPNLFTAGVSGNRSASVVLSSGAPGVIFSEEDGPRDARVWRVFAQNGCLTFDARNDSGTESANWLLVEREGATVKQIDLSAQVVRVNGSEVLTQADLQAALKPLLRTVNELNRRIKELERLR